MVVGGLELEDHQQVEPAVAEADPPDGVPAALLAAVPDALGGLLLERREVDVGEPVVSDGLQEIGHHARRVEQPLVDRIVHGNHRRRRPDGCRWQMSQARVIDRRFVL